LIQDWIVENKIGQHEMKENPIIGGDVVFNFYNSEFFIFVVVGAILAFAIFKTWLKHKNDNS
jgi:hypothetical protein